MTKMIQVRNVSETLHRKLKSRAALEGLSLSDYLTQELKAIANKPTIHELRQRLRSRDPISPSIPTADVIREERERM